jgi:hypothetical protein
LERYYKTLDEEALRQKEAAEAAKRNGNERAHSICLMKASMLGDMLKVLGRVEHEGKKPKALETLIDSFNEESERQHKLGDYDAADRAEQKAITVQFALDRLREIEENGA